MNIIIDTSVWSLALRRQRSSTSAEARELGELVREGRAAMLGPVRQELLSGVRGEQQFETLRGHLRAFPDIPLEAEDYEEAAAFFNKCRARGIQGSNTDFLICATAARRGFGILTTDTDFAHFARVLPIELHSLRASVTGVDVNPRARQRSSGSTPLVGQGPHAAFT
jgi:predicted nucleic acid-binding protein